MTSIPLLFIAASVTFNLPVGLQSAVCYVESNHNAAVINPNDGGSPSHGICQIKLNTARQMGYTGSSEALRLPNVNIYWSASYLSHCLVRYDGDVLRGISAYNSGTYRINSTGRPINLNYIRKVLKAWGEHR